MYKTTETILNRVVVFVRRPIKINGQFAFMFKGRTDLQRGRYYFNYPITNISTSRLVNRFNKIYGHHLDVIYAYGGMRDI